MNGLSRRQFVAGSLLIAGMPVFSAGANEDKSSKAVQTGDFRWEVGPPVLSAAERPNDPCYSVKDPTIVRLRRSLAPVLHDPQPEAVRTRSSICRSPTGRRPTEAMRHILTISDGYFCAPQVFYFTAAQEVVPDLPGIGGAMAAVLSLHCRLDCTDLSDPASWTKPYAMFFDQRPEIVRAWIDFWVICDARQSAPASSRRSTGGCGDPRPCSIGSPRVEPARTSFSREISSRPATPTGSKVNDQYLTIVEATATPNGRRYYKAYLADRLDGEWQPAGRHARQALCQPAQCARRRRCTGPTHSATASCCVRVTTSGLRSTRRISGCCFKAWPTRRCAAADKSPGSLAFLYLIL